MTEPSTPLPAEQVPSFSHLQSAHCESGVMAAMLCNHGLPMSEPMAFGLAGALSFAYIPLIKLSGMPLIAYRMPPRWIIKRLQQRIGLRMHFQTFRDPAAGMIRLDQLLDEGRLVGLQTSVYWLPYFPEEMRFHFNAHNLLVVGRSGDDYTISDPVFEQVVSCHRKDLQKARFARGALAAKGMLYFPSKVPEHIDYPKVIPAAIRANSRIMGRAPLPIIGIRGIRYLGRNLLKVAADSKRQDRYLPLYLGHIVRMQEEIGTGGAGFRFIYAAFLSEAAEHLEKDLLQQASVQMTAAGDEWRRFALVASKMARGRLPVDVRELDQILNNCADAELSVWQLLKRL